MLDDADEVSWRDAWCRDVVFGAEAGAGWLYAGDGTELSVEELVDDVEEVVAVGGAGMWCMTW